ncbi:MAG: LLM class F420-dependent oxidoreductase, partial [Pseudomonadales bacterium]|nr:LLM class F420-dependent oxidoreductase [Pseudomonadales bacterium]
MKIGLFATFMSPVATPEMIADFAVRVESMGVESLWMGEHVVLFDETENPYPGSRDGKIPVPEGGGMLDTVATFGFVAARTSTLRLGTGITLLPQRNPIYTAKEFANLDWLSNGRIDFGVGVGWCREEVEACGFTFEDRGRRCDEFLALLRKLWTEPVASFSGEHWQLADCHMDPKPIQKPHIPIIVGGHSRVAFRRTARFGDGWYGFQLDHNGVSTACEELGRALKEEGRTLDDLELIITPPYRVGPEMVKGYENLGVDRLIVHLGNQKPD